MREDIRDGMSVYSADGTKLGKIVECGDGQFWIEKGFFFPKEYVARYEDVSEVRGDEVFLRGSDEVLRSASESLSDDDRARSSALGGATDLEGRDTIAGSARSVDIPVHEEQLEAEKRVRTAGEVRIHKEVHTEQRQISVPVTREEVRVERVPGSGAKAGEGAFEEGTMSIPVREEEVEIHKRPVVREQVRVSRTARQEERRADADVRREEVKVDDEGDVIRKGRLGLDDPKDER